MESGRPFNITGITGVREMSFKVLCRVRANNSLIQDYFSAFRFEKAHDQKNEQ